MGHWKVNTEERYLYVQNVWQHDEEFFSSNNEVIQTMTFHLISTVIITVYCVLLSC